MKARTKKKPAAKKASVPVAKRGRPGRPSGPGNKELETVLNEVTAQPKTEHLEQWVSVPCPYCGEEFEVHMTSESDGQTQYEDCHVCCRPISLHILVEDGEIQVEAHRS